MAARFAISVDGVKQLARAISRFTDQLDDFSPAWEKVLEFMYEHEERAFDTRGFGQWEPLASGGPATLVQSGRMKRSLTERGGDNIADVKGDSLAFGTRVLSKGAAPYPLFHQRGTSKMPQRQVIFLREEDRTAIIKVIQREIVGQIKAFNRAAGKVASVSGA